MKTYLEPAKELPVREEVDVLVVVPALPELWLPRLQHL